MFRLCGILLLCSAFCASEPTCSRFHYEEQTLKKMIMVELLVEKLKAELEDTSTTVHGAVAQWNQEREAAKRELDQLQTSLKRDSDRNVEEIREIKDSMKENVLFRAREVKNLSPVKGETLIFSTTMINTGSGYDNGTGIFTAPVTGVYQFTVQLCVNNQKYLYLEILADHVPLFKTIKIDDYEKWRECFTSSVPAFINAGGQVWIKIGPVERGALWESASQNWNFFSGVLIHK